MSMFIEIFLTLCIVAQHQVCTRQPLPNGKFPAESAIVDHKSTIFSRIEYAGNCTAYKNITSEPKFRQLEEYCERTFPGGTPRENKFISYEVVLCMVLYDAVQRFCKVVHQEVAKDIQNFSGGFSCGTMINVPKAVDENTKQWVTLFKGKLGNIFDCERACIQDKMINPVCEYIWKTNTLTNQTQVSSANSAAISSTENPQVNSKDYRKTNRTMTSKSKPLKEKNSDLSSAAGRLNNGSQNIEQVDHMMTPTSTSTFHKDDLAAANGNSTQSGSTNDVQNAFKQQAQATVNTGRNDATQKALTAGSNTQNNIDKQTQGTNSNVQNNVKKPEHVINRSNQSALETPPDASVPLPVQTERISAAGNYDNSTRKSISSDSKSSTAPHSENKSSAGGDGSSPDIGNQNNDNEGFVTTENADKVPEDYIPSGDEEDPVDRKNTDNQDEKNEESPQQMENHREEAETDNTVQFNQLGDAADSHFYAYFMTMVVICIIGYLVFHNKQKILALALEGRSRKGTRRRPNTSAYRKLDSNLEEAVTSTGSTSVTHVIY